MNAPRQLALEARVLWEITVRKNGRGIYASTVSGSAFGHRRAALEMGRIVCAQHPGARLTFKRVPMDGVPMDGVPCRLCGQSIVIPTNDTNVRGALCGACR